VARVIEFYVPENFKSNRGWVPVDQRGKVVEFPRACTQEVCMIRSGAAADAGGLVATGEVQSG